MLVVKSRQIKRSITNKCNFEDREVYRTQNTIRSFIKMSYILLNKIRKYLVLLMIHLCR